MTVALAAPAISVSGASLVCFALIARAGRHRNGRRTSPHGGTNSPGDAGSHFSWFGGDYSGPVVPAIRAEATAGRRGQREPAVAVDGACREKPAAF